MYIDAFLSITGIFLSGVLTAFVVRSFLEDYSVIIKAIASVFVFFICMAGVRQTLDFVLREDMDEILQSDPMFVAVKQKYPDRYSIMLNAIDEYHEKYGSITPNQAKNIIRPQLEPIINERIAQVSDETRGEFAKASTSYFESLSHYEGTLCYDSIFGQLEYNEETLKILDSVAEQSNLNNVLLKVLTDESRDKAIVAQSKVKEVGQEMAEYLGKKYQNDLRLMAYPHQASTTKDKKKLCEMSVETIRYLNKPKDDAKMAALRLLMSGKPVV